MNISEAIAKAQSLLGAVLIKAPESKSLGQEVRGVVVSPYGNITIFFWKEDSPSEALGCRPYKDSCLIFGDITANWSRTLLQSDLFVMNNCPRKKLFLGKSEEEIELLLQSGN